MNARFDPHRRKFYTRATNYLRGIAHTPFNSSILVAKAAVLANWEFRMTWAIRSCALAVGAAALLSAQTVYAAPARTTQPAVDPLVSLSILGTTQSRAAVCGTTMSGSNCALPMAMAGAATSAASAAQDPPPPPPRAGPPFNPLLGILALLLILGIAAAIISGGGDAEGNLAPISPA